MTRQLAWEILRCGSPTPTRLVDRLPRSRELDARDRALVRRIVATEVRRRGTLRALVRAFTRTVPKPDLVAHLHVGLVQLLFLDRVPDHAAVSETSDAVARTVGASKVPFVNGVLRNVIRARRDGTSGDARRDLVGRDLYFDREVFRDPVRHPLLWTEDALSIPAALMKRWVRRYREEPAQRLARTFLEEPPLVLRSVGEREPLLAELAAAGVGARAGRRPSTIVCERARIPRDGGEEEAERLGADVTGFVTSLPAFREGRLTVQGETAARAAELLEVAPGEFVLDLCAAPGGKTAQLAQAGAHVVAVDRDPGRLALARATLERLGVADAVRLVAGDGASALRGAFDAVLVDAPCSNTGVLGARPEARWRFGPRSMSSLAALQRRLIGEAASLVRAGGRLVWSTCSLEPEENGRLVRGFLDAADGWRLEEEHAAVPDAELGPWDGGYAARLRREG